MKNIKKRVFVITCLSFLTALIFSIVLKSQFSSVYANSTSLSKKSITVKRNTDKESTGYDRSRSEYKASVIESLTKKIDSGRRKVSISFRSDYKDTDVFIEEVIEAASSKSYYLIDSFVYHQSEYGTSGRVKLHGIILTFEKEN